MKERYRPANYLEPVLVLDYVINADKASVYKAWTDLEIFQKWFCPTGFTVAKAEMISEAGGYFRIHMKSPEGQIYPTKGEYILLEKPDRIVYKDSWDDDRADNDPVVSEVVFETIGSKTKVELHASFLTENQKEKAINQEIIDGWKMFLTNLNNVIGIK